jgi:hypothetical protein
VTAERPNRRVQLTPLAASEIVRILKPDFGWILIAIYWCGATDAQHVRPLSPLYTLSRYWCKMSGRQTGYAYEFFGDGYTQ